MRKLACGFTLFLVTCILVGCNLPGGQLSPNSPNAAFTQAAETVAAELTQVSSQSSPTPVEPTATATPNPTNSPYPTATPYFTPTKAATATNTPIPCNLASFVTDVTYPDNTQVAPNGTFTKTWRIRNVGSCSWTSNYMLIFDHGDGMGVTTGYAQPLTTHVVNPGQMVDISVDLTAPASTGTYTGYWRFRDPGGVIFGITATAGTFLVKVKVVATTTVTLVPVLSESGAVRSDGGVLPGDISVGDSVENYKIQAFISYDISSIPSKATIIEVKDKFNSYTTGGDPFGQLGILNGYKTDYALPLVADNFVKGFPPGNIIDWGGTSILDRVEVQATLKTALQATLGATRFKLRLQFSGTNKDSVSDYVSFTDPSLIITYTTP